jgi:uncharacterized membrane-anchored protein YitT (DUF2179 family)
MMMMAETKIRLREAFSDYLYITLGCLFMALSIIWFLDPYKIIPGGVSGLAIVFYRFFKLPLGTTIFILNIPLFLIGLRHLGREFGIRTIIGIVLVSFFVDFISRVVYPYCFPDFPVYLLQRPETLDYMNSVAPFLASLFGGLLLGIGLGLILRARASTGGSDIVAQIFSHYHIMRAGQTFIVVDSFVILFAGITFGIQKSSFTYGVISVLLGMVSLYVSSFVVDYVIAGAGGIKALQIISDKADEIKDYIMKDLGRGATILYGEGAFTGKKEKVIYTVLSRSQVYKLKKFAKSKDPNVFIIMSNVAQVYGEGFRVSGTE